MDKYTMFKNYMHNELGITKDDIKKWTQDAVKQVAENHITQQFSTDYMLKSILREAIKNPYNSGFICDIQNAVSKALTDRLEITIK